MPHRQEAVRGKGGLGTVPPLNVLVLSQELSQSLSSCSSKVVALEKEHLGQSFLLPWLQIPHLWPTVSGSGKG